MPRPERDRRREETFPSEPAPFKQRLYGQLTTPEAVEAEARAAASKKKKGKFLGHENFYFWLYDFTAKHFAKKARKKYELPEAIEPDVPETLGDLAAGRRKKPKKKAKKKEKKTISKAYHEAFDFLGWKLDPDIVMAMPRAAGILTIIFAVVIAGAIYMVMSQPPTYPYECGDGYCDDSPEGVEETPTSCPKDCDTNLGAVKYGYPLATTSPLLLLFIMFIPIFLTLAMVTYVQKYPVSAANGEKMRALTYVPEMLNYLVMQMRLQPNLERAVDFAAEHGEGRIAEEFRELLWKNRIGIYKSIEEGLDDMAYRWEPYSEEFKHAITMVRASVLVPSDVERGILYDKAIQDVLDSTKEKMELYAHSMKQPSMYLFYIAVLLPLMIIIMLPVAAAFANLPVASTPILVMLYIVVLPLITFFYAKNVLSKRPGGYVPPEVADDNPELPKKGILRIHGMKLPVKAVTVMLCISILAVGFFLESAIKIPEQELKDLEAIRQKTLSQPTIIQYVIPLAVAIPVGFYLIGKSYNKRQVQDKIFKMELDFKDAMYLLASRLGEKNPLEDSISYVKKFMPESKVATELLENVERNIMVMGLTLKSAIFDPTYGAMKYVPSRLMASSFKIMTDSIELGPEVASTSLISVSDQIRNIQKINELMRKLLDDVTGMMESMAKFIAPVVLGIVASLQQVIIAVIAPLTGGEATSDVGSKTGTMAVEGAKSSLGGISTGAMENMATPFEFQLIIACYILILVSILAYFAGKVKYGDNRTAIMMTMGKTLPVSTIVFLAALYMGGGLVGGLAG